MFSNISKYAKIITTTVGALLILLNETLPLLPANGQHWVTGLIAVLTIVARDITEIFGGTSEVLATKVQSKYFGSVNKGSE